MSRPDTDSPLNNTKISTICQLLRYDPYCYAIKNKNEIATLTLARTNEGVIAKRSDKAILYFPPLTKGRIIEGSFILDFLKTTKTLLILHLMMVK